MVGSMGVRGISPLRGEWSAYRQDDPGRTSAWRPLADFANGFMKAP
jgi:hypothetical protein